MINVSAKQTGDWWGRQELDFLATVVSASKAWLAFIADDVGLNSDTVSNFEMLNGRVNFQYNASRFVSKDMCTSNDHRTNAARMPEMNIGTHQESAKLSETGFATYPQIPVLLIPTVTSPGFKLSPFSTLSREGAASATHRSCCGFVYTPILAFEGFSIAARGSSVAEGAMAVDILFFVTVGVLFCMAVLYDCRCSLLSYCRCTPPYGRRRSLPNLFPPRGIN
jgi:hypothetical protein